MADVKRPEQRGFTGPEEFAETGGIRRQVAAMSEASRHPQPQKEKFFKREKMPKDLSQRRRPPEKRRQICARMGALSRHQRD